MNMDRIAKITDAYVRHYTDNDSVVAYVTWVDEGGRQGRTETKLPWKWGDWVNHPASHLMYLGRHMAALFTRANREGIAIRGETW